MTTRLDDNRFEYSELGRGKAGHPKSALLESYDTAAPIVRAVLRRILASTEEAEDVLEHTFSLAAHPAKTDGAGAEIKAAMLEQWLLLTARSQGINRVRAVANASALESAATSGGDWQVKTHEIRLLESRRPLLRRLMEQLPAGQRRLLDLVLFEGQTEEEIARATNEPLGKVCDQVRAAFAFVRQRVQAVMGTWTAGL